MKSILSAPDTSIGLIEDMSFVIMEYGAVTVMIKIARFKLMTKPTLKKVARSPEATPLLSGGTELMIELILGETNVPVPIPRMAR